MSTPRNPFVFGRVVRGVSFCNRQKELQDLRRAAETGRSLWLHSPRRYGKTSLIHEAFSDTPTPFAYVDVYPAQDTKGLADAYLRGISPLLRRVSGPGDKALEWLRTTVTSFTPQISFDPLGGVSLSLGQLLPTVESRHIDEIVNLPQRLAEAHETHVTIAIDEFQEITRFKGLESQLRAQIQHHDRVTYLFSGSRRTLLADLFSDRDRPFFQFAEHYPLRPIAPQELLRFVQGSFRRTGVEVPDGVPTAIVDRAHGHPHYTQMLASRVWDLASRQAIDEDGVERALGHLARAQDLANRRWFESLSASARRVVLHIAKHGGRQLLADSIRTRSRLGPPSTVKKALVRLTDREVLFRDEDGDYYIDDPILAYWLAGIE